MLPYTLKIAHKCETQLYARKMLTITLDLNCAEKMCKTAATRL